MMKPLNTQITTGFPTIMVTQRLQLRQFTLADVPALHLILNEPGIMDYFPPTTPPDEARVTRLIQNQIKHWEQHHYGWWAVVSKETNHLLGWAGLQYLPESDETEVGYLLSHSAWGQGFATEAAIASVEAGFTHMPLTQIIGLTHPDNIASQRVLQKTGLQYVGEFEYFGMVCKKFVRSQNQEKKNKS